MMKAARFSRPEGHPDAVMRGRVFGVCALVPPALGVPSAAALTAIGQAHRLSEKATVRDKPVLLPDTSEQRA